MHILDQPDLHQSLGLKTVTYNIMQWCKFHSNLWESNLIATVTITVWFNERSWFSYVKATQIIARIDSGILMEFAALKYGSLPWGALPAVWNQVIVKILIVHKINGFLIFYNK